MTRYNLGQQLYFYTEISEKTRYWGWLTTRCWFGGVVINEDKDGVLLSLNEAKSHNNLVKYVPHKFIYETEKKPEFIKPENCIIFKKTIARKNLTQMIFQRLFNEIQYVDFSFGFEK